MFLEYHSNLHYRCLIGFILLPSLVRWLKTYKKLNSIYNILTKLLILSAMKYLQEFNFINVS